MKERKERGKKCSCGQGTRHKHLPWGVRETSAGLSFAMAEEYEYLLEMCPSMARIRSQKFGLTPTGAVPRHCQSLVIILRFLVESLKLLSTLRITAPNKSGSGVLFILHFFGLDYELRAKLGSLRKTLNVTVDCNGYYLKSDFFCYYCI